MSYYTDKDRTIQVLMWYKKEKTHRNSTLKTVSSDYENCTGKGTFGSRLEWSIGHEHLTTVMDPAGVGE